MKLHLIFSLFLVLTSISAFAQTVEDAYTEFFNNEKISGYHCGQNIHFFLQYLDQKKVRFNSGYVVSIHEEYGALNHFDARWGSQEKYDNGQTYLRSNWYFHVFAVIDGKAYDFSQNYRVGQSVQEYLERSYLPKSQTGNIPMQGRLTAEKVLTSSFNLNMRIYEIAQYRKNHGGTIYEGSFIELFNYYRKIPSDNAEGSVGDYNIEYSQKSFNNRFNSTTYKYPKAGKAGNVLPLVADGTKICRAFGYLGSVPMLMEHEVSDKQLMVALNTFIRPDELKLSSKSITISFGRESKSEANIPNQPLLHFARQVSCTNLQNVIGNL